MTSLRTAGVATLLALPLALCGCASEAARDPSPFYVAPRQEGPAPASTAPALHGGGRMHGSSPSLQDGSGADAADPGDTLPGSTGSRAGGSMSVGGGGS